jgi:hypothetical protein
MKTLLAVMIIFGVFMIQSPVVTAGDPSVNPKMNAKIARIKAKQRALARKNGTEGGAGRNSDGCGNIAIGNVTNEKGAQATRDLTVVVTGDVISTGNKCK